MPAKRKNDWTDELAAAFAAMPWWVPFALAAAAWLAIPPLGHFLIKKHSWDQLWPLIRLVVTLVLIGTGILAQVEKSRRRHLVAQARSLDALQALTWREFEQLCAEAFRQRRYHVEETVRGADGGVDLVVSRGRERIFVQCKHYAVRRVDVRPIRELFGVMAAEGATRGIFVCSGTFTAAAHQFARGKALQLIDGPKLVELVASVPAPQRIA